MKKAKIPRSKKLKGKELSEPSSEENLNEEELSDISISSDSDLEHSPDEGLDSDYDNDRRFKRNTMISDSESEEDDMIGSEEEDMAESGEESHPGNSADALLIDKLFTENFPLRMNDEKTENGEKFLLLSQAMRGFIEHSNRLSIKKKTKKVVINDSLGLVLLAMGEIPTQISKLLKTKKLKTLKTEVVQFVSAYCALAEKTMQKDTKKRFYSSLENFYPFLSIFPRSLTLVLASLTEYWRQETAAAHILLLKFSETFRDRKSLLIDSLFSSFKKLAAKISELKAEKIQTLQNSLAELIEKIDLNYSMRQLRMVANDLMVAIKHPETENIQKLYNWQTLCILKVFGQLRIEEVSRKLALIVTGLLDLMDSPKYHPYQLHLIALLIEGSFTRVGGQSLEESSSLPPEISSVNEPRKFLFIPLGCHLMKILNCHLNSSRLSTEKPPQLKYLFKVSDELVGTVVYAQSMIKQILLMLTRYCSSVYEHEIDVFPELARSLTVQLKQILRADSKNKLAIELANGFIKSMNEKVKVAEKAREGQRAAVI